VVFNSSWSTQQRAGFFELNHAIAKNRYNVSRIYRCWTSQHCHTAIKSPPVETTAKNNDHEKDNKNTHKIKDVF
jgi:hypothetical protein